MKPYQKEQRAFDERYAASQAIPCDPHLGGKPHLGKKIKRAIKRAKVRARKAARLEATL